MGGVVIDEIPKHPVDIFDRHDPAVHLQAAFDQPELDWFELALALLERRARVSDLGDFKLRMKWLKYLLGRGFNQDQARYAIATMMESETQDG